MHAPALTTAALAVALLSAVPAAAAPAGPAPTASSQHRLDAAAPWTSGIPISRPSTSKRGLGFACTAGLPARKGARTFLITAGHCAKPGQNVYTAWTNSRRTRIGKVAGVSNEFDIVAIETTGTVANRYWAGKARRPLNGVATVTRGQKVCHNGYRSSSVCGITVIGSTRNTNGVVDRVFGRRTTGTAARPGDSGGLVTDSNGRAVGIISTISKDGRTISWVPARTALTNWNMRPIH